MQINWAYSLYGSQLEVSTNSQCSFNKTTSECEDWEYYVQKQRRLGYAKQYGRERSSSSWESFIQGWLCLTFLGAKRESALGMREVAQKWKENASSGIKRLFLKNIKSTYNSVDRTIPLRSSYLEW